MLLWMVVALASLLASSRSRQHDVTRRLPRPATMFHEGATVTWQTRMMLLIVGSLIAGHAAHWFIGGAAANHSTVRNTLVIIQLGAGIGLLIWAWRTRGQSTD